MTEAQRRQRFRCVEDLVCTFSVFDVLKHSISDYKGEKVYIQISAEGYKFIVPNYADARAAIAAAEGREE